MSTIRDEKHRRLDELSVRASRAFVDSGLHGNTAEVVLALDVSESMAPLYANGFVGELTTALLALAMKFDDNGRVPVWTFGQDAVHVGELKAQDHRGWVDRGVKVESCAAPRLGPLIDAVGRRYFPAEWDAPPTSQKVGGKLKRTVVGYSSVVEPRACPVFVIAVTAGKNDDGLEATRLLRKASFLPVFWQFAGVGGGDLRFLKGIDKLTETWVDNCGFFVPEVDPLPEPVQLGGLVRRPRFHLDEERLYGGLLNELPRWLEHDKVRPMLVAETPVVHDTHDELDGLLKLPGKEEARREKERLEREERRKKRAEEAELEVSRADAWPTIKPASEQEAEGAQELAGSPADPDHHLKEREPGRRHTPDTRPYRPEDGPAPRQKRRATVAFEAAPAMDVGGQAEAAGESDELTVETAAERLLRIRARRNARKTNPA